MSLAKCIPLVLVALIFLLFVFLPYTLDLLLLLGQWLSLTFASYPGSGIQNWIFAIFAESYLRCTLQTKASILDRAIAFTSLIVLCFLYLPSTLVEMIVLTFLSFLHAATFGILGWFTLSSTVYKSWCLIVLEVSFIINLGIAVAILIM